MTATADLATVKRRQQAAWASADYGAVAARIVPMAEQLVQAAALPAGATVLDVATGTGNGAVAASSLAAAAWPLGATVLDVATGTGNVAIAAARRASGSTLFDYTTLFR